MARYELILRLDGALWLTIIFKPLLTPKKAFSIQFESYFWMFVTENVSMIWNVNVCRAQVWISPQNGYASSVAVCFDSLDAAPSKPLPTVTIAPGAYHSLCDGAKDWVEN